MDKAGITLVAIYEPTSGGRPSFYNKNGPRGPGKRARRYRKKLIADNVAFTAQGLQSAEGYEGPVIEFKIY
jgi:hypothetical protein